MKGAFKRHFVPTAAKVMYTWLRSAKFKIGQGVAAKRRFEKCSRKAPTGSGIVLKSNKCLYLN